MYGGLAALHTERLLAAIGREEPCDGVARLLCGFARGHRAPAVTGMSVSCSDEAEEECASAFRRLFVRPLFPPLKSFSRSPFRTRNLAGRYEWGSVVAAEGNFSSALKEGEWKLFLCKLNAHVSVDEGSSGPRYGRMQRYAGDSVYCAALHAFLSGGEGPFADELAEAFRSEGVDRRQAILEEVAPEHRSLVLALTSARLQARMAMLDIQEHAPRTPTLYYVAPCVTLNRRGQDTEILCGLYTADRRGGEERDEYVGLSDRPGAYSIALEGRRHVVTEELPFEPREARDHRELVRRTWDEGAAARAKDERVRTAVTDAAAHPVARASLTALLPVLFELSPIPAAVFLFAQGFGHIRHAHLANRLARESRDDQAARRMLLEIGEQVGGLSEEEQRHLVELLRQEYG